MEAPEIDSIETLRVATYNVRACRGSDGHIDIPRIVRVLTEMDADIVALQEVVWSEDSRRDQLGRIARVMGMEAIPAATLRRGPDWFGIAVISRVPVVHQGRFELGWTAGEPRCALRVDVEIDRVVLPIVTTHLGLSVRERWGQLERLETVLDTVGRSPVVLMGDFNAWVPSRDITRRLRERFGLQAWVRSFPAARPILPLDRIWVSPADALATLGVHRSNDARCASDHLPVWAEVVRPRAEAFDAGW